VIAALAELNKTANPKVALGPRERYEANLREMTEKQLKVEGLQHDKQREIFTVAFVTTLDHRTRNAEDQLRKALANQESEARKWQNQAASRKSRLAKAIQEGSQRGISDLQKEARTHEGHRIEFAKKVNACREAYVQDVAALRKAVDEAPQKIADWKKSHPDIQIQPISRTIYTNLDRAEATIATKEVPLEADKAFNWVAVLIDGKSEKKMVLDPAGDVIRMSANSATALGIDYAGDGVTEEIAMKDGQKLTARRMALKSVQVGPFSAQDVECLVFLKGFDAPPSLGASFLDRFTYRFDSDAGKLTLTRVELKPSSMSFFKAPDRTAGSPGTSH
jgi:clan AA aspartic protease (TIGR02281 family)